MILQAHMQKSLSIMYITSLKLKLYSSEMQQNSVQGCVILKSLKIDVTFHSSLELRAFHSKFHSGG